MREENPETIPFRSIFVTRFDPAQVSSLAQSLKASNCLAILSCRHPPPALRISLDRKEKWSSARYGIRKFDSNELESYGESKGSFGFPDPNPFIAKNLELVVPAPEDAVSVSSSVPIAPRVPPRTIIDNERGSALYMLDREVSIVSCCDVHRL
jgi:secreted Zn-dependent insulinase-like peptidase